MTLKKALTFFLLSSLLTLSTAAVAKRYYSPKYRGHALDWCRIFEHQCGKPAADSFCQLKGHIKATAWPQKQHPGVTTMTIGQNSICNPNHHRCDTFKFIDCKERAKVFYYPRYRGYRLDWCKVFEHQCGGPAAKSFCKSKGFKKAVSWKKQNHPGVSTMTISQNAICNPDHHRCDSFVSIKCKN